MDSGAQNVQCSGLVTSLQVAGASPEVRHLGINGDQTKPALIAMAILAHPGRLLSEMVFHCSLLSSLPELRPSLFKDKENSMQSCRF